MHPLRSDWPTRLGPDSECLGATTQPMCCCCRVHMGSTLISDVWQTGYAVAEGRIAFPLVVLLSHVRLHTPPNEDAGASSLAYFAEHLGGKSPICCLIAAAMASPTARSAPHTRPRLQTRLGQHRPGLPGESSYRRDQRPSQPLLWHLRGQGRASQPSAPRLHSPVAHRGPVAFHAHEEGGGMRLSRHDGQGDHRQRPPAS
jgi:hypothetical protein